MRSKKLLSICVPTYNRPEFLKRNLISVLDQLTENVEILVSDDSDNDDSKKIIDQIQNIYNTKINYNQNAESKNRRVEVRQAYNVNKLIDNARGTFIYILHDDDFLVKGSIMNIISVLNNYKNRYKVFLFGVCISDNDGNVKKIQKINKDRIFTNQQAVKKLISNSSFIRTPGIIIGKDVYNKVGLYNPEIELPIDFDMWTRIFPYYNIFHSKHLIANYTDHGENQTSHVFNEKYLKIILNSFETLRKKKVLNEKVFNSCKSQFFHQWILAGIYRYLMKKDFAKAKMTHDLFKFKEIKNMPISVKWLPVKLVFNLILLINKSKL